MKSKMSTDPKDFWENKILTWEEGRYEQRKSKGGLLEKIADNASSSLRYRIEIGVALVAPHVKGKHVLEVGCGSGIVAQRFIEAGAASYHGIDIAETAIKFANERKQANGWGNQITFAVGTIRDMPMVSQDIVFSLGVLDWLNDEELAILFERQGKTDFLHAIAEKRRSLSQYAHRAYVQMAYGYKTGTYRPRYFTAAEIAARAARHRNGPFYAFRDPKLSFGALITTFPVGTKI